MSAIGFDAKRAFFNSTGLGNYSRSLLHALFENYPDLDYHLYTPKKPRNRFASFEKLVASKASVITPSSAIWKTFPSIWRSSGIGRNLMSSGIELYHGLSHEIPSGLRKRGIRSVVTIHDLINLKFPQFYGWIDRRIYHAKLQHACREADCVITDSIQTKLDVQEYFKVPDERCTVVPLICDPMFEKVVSEEMKAAIKKKYSLPDNFILYVGTINERKNLLSLIKAFENLPGRDTVKLVAVGRGNAYRKKVVKYVQLKGLQKRVLFPEVSNNEDLPAIYQMAEVFVYPSLYEGFGLPILEALWSRVPVITSHGGCFEEAGGQHSLYVEPTDPESIMHKLSRVLSDSALRTSIVKAGLKHAMCFTSQKFADQTFSVYKRFLF